jgi:prepilin-type N-terminal cleavage/methylation domain-containing protein
MIKQKGFSLIEVLLSLLLLSTVALGVLEQQRQSGQLINQLQFIAGASQFLDKVGEQLVVRNTLPIPPFPYEFNLKQNEKGSILHLTWFQNSGSITRGLSQVGQFK